MRPQEPDALASPDVERLYETLFERSPDGALVVAPDGKIVRANAAACRILGWSEAELRGRAHEELVVQDERRSAVLGARERDGLARGEVLYRRADGSVIPVEETSATIPTPAAGAAFTYVVIEDARERRRTEDALRRYELLAENTRDILLFVRRDDGRIVDANRAAVEAYGHTREELLRATLHDLRAPEARGPLPEQMAQADLGATRFETVHQRKDGSTFPVEVVSHGATLGGARFLLSVVRDITERKQAEERLRESDRRKTEFLATLSHELRNPLAPIRNAIHVLDRVPGDDPQAARARDVLRRQTEHLSRIVDDLLDVSRISRGKVELHFGVVDLRDLVRQACEDHRSQFEASEIGLAVVLPMRPAWARLDPTRMGQVIGNLLHNACKFTRPHGTVTVALSAGEDGAELRVTDTGVGMDPARIASMFEPFAQGERNLARARGGLGLGLALSKALVELQGGTIRAESEGVGRGTQVVVSVPLLPESSLQPWPPPEAPAPAATQPREILLIDDNVDAAQTLADVLEMEGHHVRIAHDGRAGLTLARELRPEVVVCDIGLPGLDGYEVARALRADPSLRSVRLIALSGYAHPEDKARAAQAGFDAHLSKPAPLDELAALLA